MLLAKKKFKFHARVQKCHCGKIEKLPKWHFWTRAFAGRNCQKYKILAFFELFWLFLIFNSLFFSFFRRSLWMCRRLVGAFTAKNCQKSKILAILLHFFGSLNSSIFQISDAHCECTKGWLEPLLAEIAKNRKFWLFLNFFLSLFNYFLFSNFRRSLWMYRRLVGAFTGRNCQKS